MTFFNDTYQLLLRHIRTTLRIPIWIFVTLVQPIIWLTLYGQLFRRVVELPGFNTDSYLQFLAPGVVIMTAMFGSFWSGMALIEDLQQGVVDRFLATPAYRAALIAARVLHAGLTVLVQSILILVMAIILGASVPGGVAGLLMILLLASLLGAGFSALSNGVALLTRREESMIAVVNFFGLPLVFLSTAFIARDLMPGWIQFASRINPVNWGVNGARNAMFGDEWAMTLIYCGLLVGFVLLSGAFATSAFRSYQRAA